MTQPTEPPVLTESKRPEPTTKPPRQRTIRDSQLAQNKLAVLAVMFFVTGFLGLPLLWICKKFSSTERWVWAVVNTIYTLTLIWIVAKICWWSWSQIKQTLFF